MERAVVGAYEDEAVVSLYGDVLNVGLEFVVDQAWGCDGFACPLLIWGR